MQSNKRRGGDSLSVFDIIYGISFILVVGLLLSTIKLQTAIAKANEALASVKVEKEIVKVQVPIQVEVEDDRVIKLQSFLQSQGSPLTPYARIIIAQADKYDIGWTKIVGISKIESEYGKRTLEGSHNAWGLGGSKFMYFNTWEEGIQYASWLIGTHYKQNENQGIKDKYCPASDGCNFAWATIVTGVTNDILAAKEVQ